MAGVLLRPDDGAVIGTLTAEGIPFDDAPDVERAHYAGVAHIDGMSGHASPRPPYLAVFVEVIGVPPDHREHAEAVLLSLWNGRPLEVFRSPCRGVPDGLRLLVEAGTRCAIVSNSDGSVRTQLRNAAICQEGPGPGVEVSAIIDSAEVGIEKPDPGIFTLGLEAVGAPANRTAFVGDSVRFDVAGAAAAGLIPIHFDPFALCIATTHHHVATLVDVATWVDGASL